MTRQLTLKRMQTYNGMLHALKMISRDFMTPAQLRKKSGSYYGLDYEEALEMSYENTLELAKDASRGVKEI